MKIVREILGRIFAAWALLVFAVTMLIILIPIWISNIFEEPKRTRVMFMFFRAWLTSFFVLAGVRRKISGKKYFNGHDTYVIVCNHRSIMDPPLSSPAIPEANKTIAKIEMAKIPIFNVIYRGGSVLVDRKSEESRRKSFSRMKEVLRMGMHMCIYPEGTRNKTSEPLTRFHDGAFKLAIEAGKKVLPAVLFDTDKVIPRKKFFFWPHPVRMDFLAPVESKGKTAHELKMEVFEIMKNHYLSHRKD